jgi:hypothetical protein
MSIYLSGMGIRLIKACLPQAGSLFHFITEKSKKGNSRAPFLNHLLF